MFLALVVMAVTLGAVSEAAPQTGITTDGGGVEVTDVAHLQRSKASKRTEEKRPARTGELRDSNVRVGVDKSGANVSEASRATQRQQRWQASVASYAENLHDYNVCLESVDIERCNFPSPPDIGPATVDGVAVEDGTSGAVAQADEPRVVLTPEQAAYIAFARLPLSPAKPGVGPSPSINKWGMAAVGYPLWLWGEGSLDPSPVSDSVGGLFVSLDAHVSKIVFAMGDGTKVTCKGIGTKWGTWVKPGEPSPTCGHTYRKPSLPKGAYSVTATTYWSVAWNVTGTTGVIPFVQSARTTLPVGELQVLVR